MIDLMMIAMMAMAKGHIVNHQEEKIRCLKIQLKGQSAKKYLC